MKRESIMILQKSGIFAGLFLVVKPDGTQIFRPKQGLVADRVIREQHVTISKLRNRGYAAYFAVGYKEAIKRIDWYLDQRNSPEGNTEMEDSSSDHHGLAVPFKIDNNELISESRENSFVLGVEFGTLYGYLKWGRGEFQYQIRTVNIERIKEMLTQYPAVEYEIMQLNDDWASIGFRKAS
ncbi:hypothetical protein [Leptospira andrefontaineae]|uniref:Uncharacterized protein n=1 Tax=Leptospira andrefontaineae TaxID=2484976 RepID=A0A4R9GWZ9_9LEPT|nr:hypothetical protein [Leptospira andrefontaineae]TGK36241.1 hypothetical protein EHO65_18225 [Leptospira andrefontaineae]